MANLTVSSKGARDPWLTIPKPNGHARMRLFCFPYAGGNSSIYRTWSEQLPSTIEVCPVNLPGRGSRLSEPALTQLTDMVDAVGEALLPHLNKPFALFGHSMGAMISFELSRLLRRKHAPLPLQLFVCGRQAPQVKDWDPPTYDLPEAEFVEELRRLNGTPKGVLEHPELMQMIIPLLRADFEVCQSYSYVPDVPLDCPITAFGGLDDQDVTREMIEAWREQTTSSFIARMLPGDHFFIHMQEKAILQVLSRELHQLVSAVA